MTMEGEVKEAMMQAILGTQAAQSISVANAAEIIVAMLLRTAAFLANPQSQKGHENQTDAYQSARTNRVVWDHANAQALTNANGL